MKKAKFLVIEGLDGSGKSTQVGRIGEWFSANNMPSLITRQPSDSEIGKLARAATQAAFPIETEALSLLFAAEHVNHYHEKIAPALKRGEHVVCDRYYYSNLVYQGENAEMFSRILAYNHEVSREARRPDAVIYLDVTPEESMRRITARRSEISIFDKLDKLKALRERYLATFERLKSTENIIIVETDNQEPDDVFEKIMNKIRPLCLR
ncbi:MAG: dTMP kinase [Defluviitaleaceae bacterium]|nr:dTMP kinase [Defluviitaleaceae bacterium]